MATITLYKDKINGVGSLLDDIIKSSNNLNTQLGTLKNTIQGVNSSTCDLQSTVDSISSSSKSEDEKVEDLKKLNSRLTEFIEMTDKRDESARDAINQAKEDFYSKYSYLKPECEKSVLEHIADDLKSACEWCKEHWKLIVTIAIVVVSVAVLLIPGVGPIIAGACWGAITGAVIGGVSGGLESMANGGSFLDGFEDGAFSGAISGAISGAAFAGLGQLGSVAGKGLNALKNGAACTSKLGKGIKGVAAVTKVMDNAMDGFDTIATLDSLFGSGDIASLNAKLHENKAYNYFQTGISATAVLTNGMTSTMKCFVAGTLVVTINGLVAIENIKAGDYVLSANPDTMDVAYKPVLETYVRETDKLVHLTINGEEIVTTFDHPFYVKNKGFINASMLWIGAELVNNNGDILLVEKIYREFLDNQTRTVYNFKVDEYHTYFVGNKFVLVHNADYEIKFTNKKGLDEKEFKQQLKDQQDGLGDLTIDEYQKNRQAYKKNGRDPSSDAYQQQARKQAIATKQKEYMSQGDEPAIAKQKAEQWISDKAALHGPDQVAGGKPENITGMGNSKINSSIGRQWGYKVDGLDAYVAEQVKLNNLPGNTKLKDLNIKLTLE